MIQTDHSLAERLYEKLKEIQVDNPLCRYTYERCKALAPTIASIERLKKEKDALILAHSYVHPDIIYGVADHVGDSFYLSKIAKETDNQIIVFPAVRFMAETAKILNPEKTVIDPNPNGGCSLADSIDASTVYTLRQQYPDHTFVCYINTSVEVKAACDVCVTSANALSILENLPEKQIYFLPDRHMGHNLAEALKAKGIEKEIVTYNGACYVHEEFSSEQIDFLRASKPEMQVLAHLECQHAVAKKADFVGSTGQIISYIHEQKESRTPFLILTECGIVSRLQVEHPKLNLIGTCLTCKYMRSNSLTLIEQALQNPNDSQMITIPETIHQKALNTVENMFKYNQA